MLGRRGASHADWAISLGIFLVYILSMLMIIQPGAQPIYREDRLLKIVKDNYKNETAYYFYKTPLIVNTANPDVIFEPGTPEYQIIINADFPFSGEPNDYTIINADGSPVPKYYFSSLWDQIKISASLAAEQKTFYIISNKRADGTSESYASPSGDLTGIEISNTASPTPNFTLIIGSTEVLTGVDEAQLTAGGSVVCSTEDDYDTLKALWAYPSSKDFATFYAEGSSPRYTLLNEVCNQTEPYEQASVFVEEWAARLVDKLGNIEPIRMVVRVW